MMGVDNIFQLIKIEELNMVHVKSNQNQQIKFNPIYYLGFCRITRTTLELEEIKHVIGLYEQRKRK